ncbi:aurora kinase A- and ninein-interacting protein [Brachyistius frenatus]|uniref:aurora kinase A- and ninein-interacting protein n=1 Tax=Brachyistius frenatus TaxID=100188 RepID=UPI0037E9721E
MKTSKAAPQTCTQDECGVWLDPVQLKGKAKRKGLARPISKLLNPFADGGGYSLAVALNFTQSKTDMSKTKQSSISTFFTPHRRVLNKMCTSEVPNMDLVLPFPSSISTAPTTVASGRKRVRDVYPEKCESEPGVDHEWESENVTEWEATLWERQAASHSPSKNMHCKSKEDTAEECKPPRSKKKLTDASSLPRESQPLLQAWSQDPLLSCSQYSESELHPTDQKYTTEKNLSGSEMSFLNSLQNEEAFGNLMDLKGRTSTQKSLKHLHSPQMDDEKENNRSLSSNSPSKLSHFAPFSNRKWMQPKTVSPRKHTNQLWKKSGKQEILNSQTKWTKPSSSPLKNRAPLQRSGEADDDSLAVLFTQDSEGFRVIAHRSLQTRSPLKDQSNVSIGTVTASAFKSVVEDEEDEMLFTQDSQGNVVIKH